MNFREFLLNLPEMRAPGGWPAASLSPELEQHLDDCPACAASLERQAGLTAALRALADESRRESAPPRVEARLLAEFRRQARVVPLSPGPWHRAPLIGWAAAAILVVSAALLLTEGRQPLSPQNALPAANQLASVDADELDSGSDFIPLPNAGQVDPSDDMDMVRVEVPRSAMIAAGFAVSADRASEPVEADVLIGPDGLMRAVRFVN